MDQTEAKGGWSELVSFLLGLVLIVFGVLFLAATVFWTYKLEDPLPIRLYLADGLLLVGVGWLVFRKATFFFE